MVNQQLKIIRFRTNATHDDNLLRRRIRYERKVVRGWSRMKMAEILNLFGSEVTHNDVYLMEEGDRLISHIELIRFSEIFGTTVANLLAPFEEKDARELAIPAQR